MADVITLSCNAIHAYELQRTSLPYAYLLRHTQSQCAKHCQAHEYMRVESAGSGDASRLDRLKDGVESTRVM